MIPSKREGGQVIDDVVCSASFIDITRWIIWHRCTTFSGRFESCYWTFKYIVIKYRMAKCTAFPRYSFQIKKKDCYFVVLYITGNSQIIGKQSELCFTIFVILDNFTL